MIYNFEMRAELRPRDEHEAAKMAEAIYFLNSISTPDLNQIYSYGKNDFTRFYYYRPKMLNHHLVTEERNMLIYKDMDSAEAARDEYDAEMAKKETQE